MSRGQGEFLGAVAVMLLTVMATYVAGEWISAIGSVAREAVNMVERSKEVLEVVLDAEGVKVVNRGPRRSHIDLLYLELSNGTIVVERVSKSVASGNAVHIDLDSPGVRRACVETGNGNTFCSSEMLVAPPMGMPFLSVERVPPTRLKPLGINDANHVPYRDRRVVAPGTSFNVFAAPRDRVTVVHSGEELLKNFPIYVNVNPKSEHYILIRWRGSEPMINAQALVDHDDDTRSTIQVLGTQWLSVCVDLGSTASGWFYLYLQHRAWTNEPWMYIAVSNATCADFSQGEVVFWVAKDDIYRGGPYGYDVRGVWLINARSILVNTSIYYEFHSIEFYPYNATKTMLVFSPLLYKEPITTTVSVFALSDTYVQVVESMTAIEFADSHRRTECGQDS